MDTILNLHTENPVRAQLRRTGRVLLEPSKFFRYDFPGMDTAEALAFGVGNGWAAAVAAFFMETMNSLLLTQLLDRWMQRMLSSEDGFSVWSLTPKSFLYASGLVILAPFLLLLQASLGGFGLYAFARLLIEDRAGAPEPVTFDATLRIQSAALCARWYSLVPVFGGLLAFLASIILTVTGVRERFGVSTRRAAVVVLAPYLMLVLCLVLFAVLAALMISQLPFSELMDVET